MRKGMFVVFEGPDGCGKSSVMSRVGAQLGLAQDVPVRVTLMAEPTRHGPFGKPVRERLTGTPAGELTMLFGMLADRAWHVEEEILPALERGQVVLCDRYMLSTMFYQGQMFSGAIPPCWFETLPYAFPKPDLQILLSCPVEVCRERLAASGRPRERYEGDDAMDKVGRMYRELAERLLASVGENPIPGQPRFTRVVDANREMEDVVKDASEVVLDAWRNWGRGPV